MALSSPLPSSVRRLQWTLGITWSVAWLGGLIVFAAILLRQEGEMRRQTAEAELAVRASAVYGLVWFEERGRAHTEALEVEPWATDEAIEIWVVEPGAPAVRHVEPAQSRIPAERIESIAAEVVALDTEQQGELEGFPFLAIPTYMEGAVTEPHAAIVTVGSPVGAGAGPLARLVLMLSSLLGAVGIVVGVLLARWSVRPTIEALEQRERFLVASAHELRSPVASLLAVCESGIAGDEAPEAALKRAVSLSRETAERVDGLLLYARLDAGQASLKLEPVRLDLLVEAEVPEGTDVVIEGDSSHVVDADPKLVRVALRNLVENAQRHGDATPASLHVEVSATKVTVRDAGPGYPQAVLDLPSGSRSFAPSTSGAGVGLATARMIVELHGGTVAFENPPGGGARATIALPAENNASNKRRAP
jgi:signal transduction histidine kinase